VREHWQEGARLPLPARKRLHSAESREECLLGVPVLTFTHTYTTSPGTSTSTNTSAPTLYHSQPWRGAVRRVAIAEMLNHRGPRRGIRTLLPGSPPASSQKEEKQLASFKRVLTEYFWMKAPSLVLACVMPPPTTRARSMTGRDCTHSSIHWGRGEEEQGLGWLHSQST